MVWDDGFRLLLVANGIGALATSLVSPLLDTLTGPFGVSTAEIGLMVTAITAPPVLLIPFSGALTDRYGRKPILVAGLFLFGLGGMAIAFTTDFRVALGLRVLQGIGFSGVTPVIITSIGDLYTGDAEATAQGIRFGVTGFSQALFPALAGILVAVAWYYPFYIYGLGIPVTLAVLFWFEEPADETVANSGANPANEGGGEDGYLRELGRLVTRRHVLPVLVARAVVMLTFIGFLTYNSVVVVRLQGGTPGQAGLLVALFSIVYAITATQAGRITAAFELITVPLIGANVLLAGGLMAFGLAPSVSIATLAVVVMGVGNGTLLSLYRNIITSLAPQRLRGGLVSLSESSGRLVSTLAPILIGAALVTIEPTLGEAAALRTVIVATGGLTAVVGIGSLFVAHYSGLLSVVEGIDD